jgi:glycosyl transferase, family 25
MKSFIICLSRIPSSLESARKTQVDLAAQGLMAELFEGTYGSDAAAQIASESRKVHGYPEPSTDKYYFKQLRPGVQGCFFSHYRLWKRCLDLAEPIMIFEDDVQVYRSYFPVEFPGVLITCLGAVKRDRYLSYLYSPSGEPRATAYFNTTLPGACGYAIQPSAAEKLVKIYEKTYLAADNAISTDLVDIRIHNYLIGEANTNKISLTKTSSFWQNFPAS